MTSILFIALVQLLLVGFVSAAFNQTVGLLSVYLTSATYCNVSTYETRTFTGMATGFKVTKTINSAFGTVGYVGYLPSEGQIYAVFRGSSSVRNWLSDFDVVKKNYESYPECECEVAQGFYNAEQSIASKVITEVRRLKLMNPSYNVIVTGHSYGASVAQLLSMDIVKAGIPCDMYNFGQPRTGDWKYANFVGTIKGLNSYRVVHNQDIVPHWPFTEYMDYYHVCSEAFEDKSGAVKICGSGTTDDGKETCEDPTCSSQFKPYQWRNDDHMTYLGVYFSCESASN